jgi:hypothetical protein
LSIVIHPSGSIFAVYNTGKKPRDKTGHHAIAIALSVMEEPEDLGPHTRKLHRAAAIALGTIVALEDPDLHMTTNHRGAPSYQST